MRTNSMLIGNVHFWKKNVLYLESYSCFTYEIKINFDFFLIQAIVTRIVTLEISSVFNYMSKMNKTLVLLRSFIKV